MKTISTAKAHGGVQGVYSHASDATRCEMTFAVFVPPQAAKGPCPVLWYLSGLTCTHQNVMDKGEYRRKAAALGLIVVCPDTSPRGTDLPGQADAWDFGVAAGFYLDATQAPWTTNWRMESYLLKELLPAVQAQTGLQRFGLMGHSMGGHGALTLALRHPGRFASVSAIAPICAPTQCPWGRKAFSGYLGPDEVTWAAHDASRLMSAQTSAPYPAGIRIDQGLADKFLAEQLMPEAFEAACSAVGQPLQLVRHEGYDHGYYFIASVISVHLRHHARLLVR